MSARADAHESAPDGRADRPAGETFPHGFGFVVTGPDAGDQLGRVADEPGVPVIIGGPGLSGGRALPTEVVKRFGGAVDEDVLEHRGRDIGDGRGKDRVDRGGISVQLFRYRS